MHASELRDFAKSIGIGAAGLMLAAGAVSLFLRPNTPPPDQSLSQPPKAAATTRVLQKIDTLPANYLDICRAAGL